MKQKKADREISKNKRDAHRSPRTKTHPRNAEVGERLGEEVLITGRKPMIEILNAAPERVLEIYLRAGLELSTELRDVLLPFSEGSPRDRAKITTLSREEFDALSSFPDAQGVAMRMTPAPEIELKELIRISKQRSGILLLIDQVMDPQNFGAILRSAEALGTDGVVATTRHTAPSSVAMRKASVGASEMLPICRVNSLHGAIKEVRSAGYWIVGTDLGDEVQSIYDTDFAFPLAIVVGSEAGGLRRLTRDDCDYCVKIPLRGRMQSLNVAQATSIVLYEVMRKRQAG